MLCLIDYGMSLQEAVEAPRVWTEGHALEVELAVPDSVHASLASMGREASGCAYAARCYLAAATPYSYGPAA